MSARKGATNGAAVTAPPAEEKQFARGDRLGADLRMLPPEQRAAVEAAIGTPDKARALYRAADRAGDPEPGTDIRVAEIAGAWLLFRETASRVELVGLIPDEAFRQLGVRLTPADGVGKAVPLP